VLRKRTLLLSLSMVWKMRVVPSVASDDVMLEDKDASTVAFDGSVYLRAMTVAPRKQTKSSSGIYCDY
jgi:hypothetical protein